MESIRFEKTTFKDRFLSMFSVDCKRMFTTGYFYLLAGIAFVMPILILVMTTMMDGSVSTNPQTGEQTVMQGFSSVWQAISSISSTSSSGGMSMDLTSMCNLNLIYFVASALICVFVCEDFRSGYAKNLFTVRSKKGDYVISKTIVSLLGGGIMVLCFFVGALLGGGISNLSFALTGTSVFGIICCLLSKVLVMGLFAPFYVLMSVIAKQKTWLAILLSLGAGMLFFAIIPMVSPLDATPIHVIGCLAGGVGFCVGFGAISNLVLNKTALV